MADLPHINPGDPVASAPINDIIDRVNELPAGGVAHNPVVKASDNDYDFAVAQTRMDVQRVNFGQGANAVRAYIAGSNTGSGLRQFLDLGSGDTANGVIIRMINVDRFELPRATDVTALNVVTAPASWVIRVGAGNQMVVDNSPSMRRVKRDIKELDSSYVEKLATLTPVSFIMRVDGSERVGFIAEDVAEADPMFALWGPDFAYDENGQIVRDDENQFVLNSDAVVPTGINWDTITSSLLLTVQELMREVKALKVQVAGFQNATKNP